ncbi:MAG: elongation factor P [Candidatus Andersenbacteria bacterium]
MSILTLSDIRKGKIITLDGEPFLIASAEFLRKQQRRPVVRSILRNIKTGQTREHSFQQSDKVPEADVEKKPYQFLYSDGGVYTFMDQATYEQVELSADVTGDAAQYLLEGQEAAIVLFEGQPIGLELPIKIDRKVIDAPPGVRGDTSSNVTKDITVEGGVKMKAPMFIEEGETIRIDTRDGSYVERA